MNAEDSLDASTDIVVGTAKRVLLLQPLAAHFDRLPMMEPLERLKLLGRVVVEAAGDNDHIREIVMKMRYMEAVKHVARERMGGGAGLPQLKADLPGKRANEQESS